MAVYTFFHVYNSQISLPSYLYFKHSHLSLILPFLIVHFFFFISRRSDTTHTLIWNGRLHPFPCVHCSQRPIIFYFFLFTNSYLLVHLYHETGTLFFNGLFTPFPLITKLTVLLYFLHVLRANTTKMSTEAMRSCSICTLTLPRLIFTRPSRLITVALCILYLHNSNTRKAFNDHPCYLSPCMKRYQPRKVTREVQKRI